MTKENFYYPELDGLRFFAFLLVFIHHAPIFTGLRLHNILHEYGWMGVDLFLCLSAFLFAKLLFIEHNSTGRINIKNFYIRRALRIWPLYFVFWGILLFLAAAQSQWDTVSFTRMLGMAFFMENIFAAAQGYNPLLGSAHLWTISYEEQFYAVIPWFLRSVFKLGRGRKIAIMLVIFLFFSAVRAGMIYANFSHPAIWVLPISHFESILGGLAVGLGLFTTRTKIPSAWLVMAVGLACLGIVCTLPNVEVVGWSLMLTYPLVGLGMSLILLSMTVENQWFVKKIVYHPWLAYFGKISYGLYVYHIIALEYGQKLTLGLGILPKRLALYPLSIFVIGLFLSMLAAGISYQWLEKPFLRLKERFSLIRSRPI